EENLPINFANQVVPIFTKLGCNSGGCHGKMSGQNGFRLSLLGFEPDLDYQTLVKEGRGRRVFPAAPDNSLLLLKAAGRVPHGGGVRLPAASPDYQTLRAWVAAGTPFRLPSEPPVAAVRVEPRERVLAPHERQQLRVVARLKKLTIAPSDLADAAEFCRRVYLDVIGTLPTADEARRFLADPRPDKRARLVDELLERPEFADYWALKWADLLRVDRQALGHKHAYAYYRWIHDSFAANKPLDQFVRELLTAEGPLQESGPASFYKVV